MLVCIACLFPMQARERNYSWVEKIPKQKSVPRCSPGHGISQRLFVRLAVGSHTTAAAQCKHAQLKDKGNLLHVTSLPWLLPEPALILQHKAARESEHGPACPNLAQGSLTRPSVMLLRHNNFVPRSIPPWNMGNWSQIHTTVLKSGWILFRNTQITGLSPENGSNLMV